ncbi:MAG: Fic family protein, partial [Bacteroidota bacterium]|nr:Fic family protein [Bacteroidota bacterium]
MTKKDAVLKIDQPFNRLPPLPPDKEKTETKKVLRQAIASSIA